MKDRIVPNLPLPTPVTKEEIAAKQGFPHGWAATGRTDFESFTVIAIGDVDAVHDYIDSLNAQTDAITSPQQKLSHRCR